MKLEQFLWIVHFSRSGIRHADILLLSGFSTQERAHPYLPDDEREFASLGRHVGSLIDNAGLVAELDQERTSLRQANEQLDAARKQLEQIFRALKSDGLALDDSQVVDAERMFNLAAIGMAGAIRTIQLVDARDGSPRPASGRARTPGPSSSAKWPHN